MVLYHLHIKLIQSYVLLQWMLKLPFDNKWKKTKYSDRLTFNINIDKKTPIIWMYDIGMTSKPASFLSRCS